MTISVIMFLIFNYIYRKSCKECQLTHYIYLHSGFFH